MALPPFHISIVQEAYPFRVLMTFLCLNYHIKKVVDFTTNIQKDLYRKSRPDGRLMLFCSISLERMEEVPYNEHS